MTVEQGPDASEAFDRAWMGRMATTLGLVVGHESGLLARLAEGPGTSEGIAADVGTDPRMTAEWLRVMVVSGFAGYADGVFIPGRGLADALTVPGIGSPIEVYVAGVRRDLGLLDLWRDAVVTGRGIDPAHYQPVSRCAQDVMTARELMEHLLPSIIGPVEGLADRLAAGIDVLDLGCGAGRVLQLMAEAHPTSRYTGYDLDEDALQMARERTTELEAQLRFERRDALDLPSDAFDLVIAVDTIHDLGDPTGALAAVQEAVRDDGVFVMVETDAAGDFETDRHEDAAWEYFSSLARCIPVSQWAGGPGLGSLWGRAQALPMLAEAGFSRVAVHSTPSGRAVYACRT